MKTRSLLAGLDPTVGVSLKALGTHVKQYKYIQVKGKRPLEPKTWAELVIGLDETPGLKVDSGGKTSLRFCGNI